MDVAKFNSHDSGSHFKYRSQLYKQKKQKNKNGYWKKKSYIIFTGLKLQIRLSMQSLHKYTLMKISTFWKKMGDEAEVVQYAFNSAQQETTWQ